MPLGSWEYRRLAPLIHHGRTAGTSSTPVLFARWEDVTLTVWNFGAIQMCRAIDEVDVRLRALLEVREKNLVARSRRAKGHEAQSRVVGSGIAGSAQEVQGIMFVN